MTETLYQRYRRKAKQAWEMARLAKQDGDKQDEIKQTKEALEFERLALSEPIVRTPEQVLADIAKCSDGDERWYWDGIARTDLPAMAQRVIRLAKINKGLIDANSDLDNERNELVQKVIEVEKQLQEAHDRLLRQGEE